MEADETLQTIELIVFRARWDGREFRLIAHQDYCWVKPVQLLDYSFTPADQPFVRKIANGTIRIDGSV